MTEKPYRGLSHANRAHSSDLQEAQQTGNSKAYTSDDTAQATSRWTRKSPQSSKEAYHGLTPGCPTAQPVPGYGDQESREGIKELDLCYLHAKTTWNSWLLASAWLNLTQLFGHSGSLFSSLSLTHSTLQIKPF